MSEEELHLDPAVQAFILGLLDEGVDLKYFTKMLRRRQRAYRELHDNAIQWLCDTRYEGRDKCDLEPVEPV